MTASNVVIEELINALKIIWNNGTRMINIDMVPDEDQPNMNKIIIHPIQEEIGNSVERPEVFDPSNIRDIEVDRNNNDIFNLLNELV